MTQNFAKSIIKVTPKWIQSHVFHKNETILYVYPEHLTAFLLFLRDHMNTQYKVLIDVTAIDYPSRAFRFEVVYNLLVTSSLGICKETIKVRNNNPL